MAKIITYECEQCGSEIVVTATGEAVLSPIYCCGVTVTEVSSAPKKQGTAKKKPVKKVIKKVAKKIVEKKAAKKKPAPKKKP